MLGLVLLLPSAYTTDGHASQGLSVIGLDSMHSAKAAALNRTEALVQWADRCAAAVPPGLNVQQDCFNLAIAGGGSRTIYDLAQDDGWKRAIHEHQQSVPMELSKSSPPRCFVVELREPAARIESAYKDETGIQGQPINEFFEKHVLASASKMDLGSRVKPIIWYFRNYEGLTPKQGMSPTSTGTILKGTLAFYKDNQDQMQVPGIDVSKATGFEGSDAVPALSDAPLVDCEDNKLVIGFACVETLVPSFEAFVSSAKAGTPITPPTGLQVGVNPVLNASKYPQPVSKFMLSEQNRRIWNDAFNFDDMTLYRHFCLGEVDDALLQQNADAGGVGINTPSRE